MPSTPSATPTPITPPRVSLIDPRTGLIDRAWYMFFLSLFTAASNAENADTGPSATGLLASFDAELRLLADVVGVQYDAQSAIASLAAALATAEQQTAVQPPAEIGELQQQIDTLQQTVSISPALALGTMAQIQQAAVPWVTFETLPDFVPPNVGTVAWDGGTTLGVQATTNVVIRVGEAEYIYVKASSAVTKGQVCYHTGSVGASGVITVAPAPLTLADPNQIVGVAAETIALNGFGLIQISGTLRGFNTTGSSVGETWADGDALYYNPAYVGSMTNVKPSAPNQKTYMGEVINAALAGSGSMSIRITPGSVLGGTDSNVQFGTLTNGDLIQYNSALGYWKNVPSSTFGTGTVTSVALSMPTQFAVSGSPVTTAGTLTAAWNNQTANYVLSGPTTGAAAAPTFRALVSGDIPALSYVSSVSATAPITSTGGLTPTIGVTAAALTKSDDTNVTLTLGGSPTTALLAATSLTLGWTGQLAVSRGGTGVSTATANYVFAGPTSGGAAAPSFRALVAADIPTLAYVTSVTGTSPVVSSGGTTPAISLASGYGDTQNPYASKTANYVLAAPNGSAGVPTFRALVAADIPALPYNPTAAPATYTANFSVATTDVWIINNKSGSSCTATLPTASSYSGRVLYFQNYQAQTLVSASSNVVPVGGGAAATSILLASAGDQCTLVSNGTNWIMMQYVPNNSLLLE